MLPGIRPNIEFADKNKKNSIISNEVFVGDIDLSSKQMLDFIQFLLKRCHSKSTF
jgi:hypothetical protein